MGWTRFRDHEGRVRLGIAVDGEVRAIPPSESAAWPQDLRQAVQSGDMRQWIEAGGGERDEALFAKAAQWEPATVQRILAPIVNPPKNIICVGRNYRDHALEAARFRGQTPSVPSVPIYFTKPHTAICGPDDEIRYDPDLTEQLDYEGELAVIIGRAGSHISADDAEDYIYGYTLFNDVTARDLQARHQQYFLGKGLDTYGPMGPSVVPRFLLPSVGGIQLTTRVNGEIRQQDTVANLIFPIPELIRVLSRGMTLEPGDIIATGTPAGVGAGFHPPRFLRPGDVVEVQAPPIGVLRNTVGHPHR